MNPDATGRRDARDLIGDLARARASGRVLVMGIVNVTPDSFSDGGRYLSPDDAVRHAARLCAEGADVLDVGGESTRPGAEPVGEAEELDRVMPVLERLSAEVDCPVSIDTSKPGVMRAAVAAGAVMINDVNGLRAEGALEAVAELGVPACIMHMQGEPRSMQLAPTYRDVVAELLAFFGMQIAYCQAAGILRQQLVLDPGFGFGKNLEHNLELLARLGEFKALDCPLMVGISRKSMLGQITSRGHEAPGRAAASLAAAVLAAERGATLVRVHDVADTVDALKVCQAVGRHNR